MKHRRMVTSNKLLRNLIMFVTRRWNIECIKYDTGAKLKSLLNVANSSLVPKAVFPLNSLFPINILFLHSQKRFGLSCVFYWLGLSINLHQVDLIWSKFNLSTFATRAGSSEQYGAALSNQPCQRSPVCGRKPGENPRLSTKRWFTPLFTKGLGQSYSEKR